MSKLKLSDLKEQGLTLTKAEAHELLSIVSQHSQHTPEDGVVFPGGKGKEDIEYEPMAEIDDPSNIKIESDLITDNAPLDEYTETPSDPEESEAVQASDSEPVQALSRGEKAAATRRSNAEKKAAETIEVATVEPEA